MSLMSRLRDFVVGSPEERGWLDLGLDTFNMGGISYILNGLNQTLPGQKVEEVEPGFESLAQRAYAANGIVFACELARVMLFTEARFQFQEMPGGVPGDLVGGIDGRNPAYRGLTLLNHPWPGGTTGDLLKVMLIDADLAGISYVARPEMGQRLERLRPDWVKILWDRPIWEPGANPLAYGYTPGGPGSDPVVYPASEVAYFSLAPNPLSPRIGVPWIASALPQLMSHQAASLHKRSYWEHGASPNFAVQVRSVDPKKFNEWVQVFRQNHEGARNAARTLFVSEGTTVTPLGNTLQEADLKAVQGADETVICAAAGVPPVVVGISEGLQGSSLNSGNFAASMRRFADMFARPAWRNAAGSLESIIPPPPGMRLWYADDDIPALKDDIKDAADALFVQAQAIRQLSDGGYDPDSVVDAIVANDLRRLKHTGAFSVQLHEPGAEPPKPATAVPMTPDAATPPNGKAPAVAAPAKEG